AWQHHQAKVEELQALYTQQGINMLKMQKRVDAALKKLDKRRDELWSKWKEQADMQDQGAANAFEEAYWILEQALKGDQYDEHRKKAEEAISKGASLTNHRIEL
ncbi:hypothetical protein FJV14_20830, partial [Acinetobacter baumannii]